MDMKVEIRWVKETDSTQDELKRRISGCDNMSVIAAEFQTAGRGQRGNSWHALKGENLTFSMLLRFGEGGFPPLNARKQFVVTKAATLGVVHYLNKKSIGCSIKWPNDIYVRDKKICGMLIESVLDGENLAYSIVGIGVNVNQRDFPAKIVNPVSMTLLTGEEYNLEDEMEILASSLADSFTTVLSGKPGAADEEYERLLYRKGSFYEYTRCPEGETFEGRIIGTTEDGLLLLEDKKGELNKFAFKEISYII